MQSPYLLGVDIGSMGMKTALFTLEGEILHRSFYEYPIYHPEPLAAEHDPETWLVAFKQTVKETLKQTRVKADDIVGVGIDCFCPSVIPMDAGGRVLRPSIFFMDQRNIGQAEEIREILDEEWLFELVGNRIAPSAFSAPILLWIKEKQRDVFRDTHKFLHANGYLAHYLTGNFTMDWTNASLTLLFDVKRRRDWMPELCEKLMIPLEKLPDPVAPWEVVGEVTSEAARETGLSRGTVVVGGGADTACAALGLGSVEDGEAIDDSGTATKLALSVDKPRFVKETMNRCHVVPGHWLLVAPSSTTGASLRWFKEQFGESEGEKAALRGVSPFQIMNEEAENSPLGANGLIFLPYMAPGGERSPIWNPYARGVLFGLTLGHKKEDIIRAFLEASAYALNHNIEAIERHGIQVKDLRVSGGQATSRLWRQIKADVTGKEVILTPYTQEATVFGVSILAGVGAQCYPDPFVVKEIVKVTDRIEPIPEAHQKYKDYFSLYKEIYHRLKESFTTLNKIR